MEKIHFVAGKVEVPYLRPRRNRFALAWTPIGMNPPNMSFFICFRASPGAVQSSLMTTATGEERGRRATSILPQPDSILLNRIDYTGRIALKP